MSAKLPKKIGRQENMLTNEDSNVGNLPKIAMFVTLAHSWFFLHLGFPPRDLFVLKSRQEAVPKIKKKKACSIAQWIKTFHDHVET